MDLPDFIVCSFMVNSDLVIVIPWPFRLYAEIIHEL